MENNEENLSKSEINAERILRRCHVHDLDSGGVFSEITGCQGSEKQSPYGNINFEESDVKHVDGAISMASTGAKVGGSAEFFICDGEQKGLDGPYAAFGVTIEGLDVVHAIAAVDHDNSHPAGGGKPYTDIVINSITIE